MLLDLLHRLFGRSGADAVWDGGPGACVLVVEADGRLGAMSDGAPLLLGRSRAAAAGLPLAALFAEEDRARALEALAAAPRAGKISLSLRLPEGETRTVDMLTRPRPDGRRAVLLIESERRLRNDELKAQVAAARAEAKAKADMLADLSHEMRTPLNAVIGFADAMKGETFGPLGHEKYGEYAEHIRASGGHLLDLISSILDLAKIEADRFALRPEMVAVGRLAEESAAMVRLAAEAAGLTLTAAIADDLPESWLDPRAVRQILINLLSNAVKFTSDGEIKLAVRSDANDIVLTVSDTGVGMSEAELKKLGARFTAAHGEGVRGAKGAGLGLALAFALAELHGGSMRLESAPGEGLTATVRLPIKSGAKPERRLKAVASGIAVKAKDAGQARPRENPQPEILTQLERIEAYRRERASAA